MIPFRTADNKIGVSLLSFGKGKLPDGSTYWDDEMDDALAAIATAGGGSKGRLLEAPAGKYRFARTINLQCQLILRGESVVGLNDQGTQFVFDADVPGIIVHRYNTSASGGFADASRIEDISILSAGGTNISADGIKMFARATLHNVVVEGSPNGSAGFGGHGINIVGDTYRSAEALPRWSADVQYKVGQSVDNATVWAPSTSYSVGDQVENLGGITAWAPITAYVVGAVVKNGGRLYQCSVAGTSAASGGPSGFVRRQVDGTAKWDSLNGLHFVCVTAGTSAASGGPVSIASGIADGTAVWDFHAGHYICKQAGTSAGTGPKGNGLTITDGTAVWGHVAGTNANNFGLLNVRTAGTRGSGVRCVGADSNAGWCVGVDVFTSEGWGVDDSSFLGNYWFGCHVNITSYGAYRAGDAAGSAVFLGCYSEGGSPPSSFVTTATVIGGLHGAGFVERPSGIIGKRMGQATWYVDGVEDTIFMGGDAMIAMGGHSAYTKLKFVPYDGTPTGVKGVFEHRWAGLNGFNGHGHAGDGSAIFQALSERARFMTPSQFWTAMGFGILVEGKRISFCDSVTRPSLGFGGSVTDMPGDVIFKRTPAAGESLGWVCTVGGTSSAYVEGLTATSAGGTSITLSGNTHNAHGLQIGDRVLINGVTTYITNRGIGPTTSITVADAIPAGSGLAIVYVPGVYGLLPQIETAIQDDSGSPSTTYTQDATAGKFVIMSGEHVVIVNNAYCTTNSIITCSLGTLDLGISGHWRVACGAGGFIFETNSNATNNVTVSWVLRN